jgi:hypothetical protein
VLGKNKGFVKLQYRPSGTSEVFSMAYGCPAKFSQDNGRVLGYDTKHGHDPIDYGPCHRHYLAQKEAFHLSKYEQVFEIFSTQWPAIVQHYSNNDTLDNFQLPG